MYDIHAACRSACPGNKDRLKAILPSHPAWLWWDGSGNLGLQRIQSEPKVAKTSEQGGVVVLVMPVVMPCVAIFIHCNVQMEHTQVRQTLTSVILLVLPLYIKGPVNLLSRRLTTSNVVLHEHTSLSFDSFGYFTWQIFVFVILSDSHKIWGQLADCSVTANQSNHTFNDLNDRLIFPWVWRSCFLVKQLLDGLS